MRKPCTNDTVLWQKWLLYISREIKIVTSVYENEDPGGVVGKDDDRYCNECRSQDSIGQGHCKYLQLIFLLKMAPGKQPAFLVIHDDANDNY